MTKARQDNGDGGSPTVRRIVLGGELRKLREAKGISREDAGYRIRASASKISRMENGRVGFKVRDIEDLLVLYGVTDRHQRKAMVQMYASANEPGWWQRFNDVQPAWFQAFPGLEEAAEMIRTYEVQFVPGLLQTPGYARAVIMLEHGNKPKAEVDRRVELRMRRKDLLSRENAPQFWAVIDEAVLRRPIGGEKVLRDQVRALIDAAKAPNVRLQMMPFGHGGHAAAGGAFTLLRFPDPAMPDMVFMEQLTSAIYLEKRDEVDHYAAAMERLCVEAETPARTITTLRRVLKELGG